MSQENDIKKDERRFFTGEISLSETRAGDENSDGESFVEGYAAVFDSETVIGNDWFAERIAKGAFEGRLKDNTVALFNHNSLHPLSKRGAGLELSTDKKGLKFRFPLPNTTQGNDLKELISRGIVSDASFAFTVKKDSWEKRGKDALNLRTIEKIGNLIDISVVTIGAYPEASSALRSQKAFEELQDSEDKNIRLNSRSLLIRAKFSKLNPSK